MLADAGYCSKRNSQAAKDIGAVAFIADNPRRKGKDCKMSSRRRLKRERYVVEQFNGHLKANLLNECWIRPKGLTKKAADGSAGLIGYNVEAIRYYLLAIKV